MTNSLSARIAAAARAMESEIDPGTTMERAVRLAVDLVTNAQDTGISLVQAECRIDTPAASSDTVVRIDELQHEHQEGPCLDAIGKQETVRSPDIGRDERWRTWGPQVVEETGVRSMMCFRLFTHDGTVGALSFYSRRTDAFDEVDREHGLAIAAHTAIAVSAAQEISQLQSGMDSRLVIGQAQGILMERFHIDPERAFQVLTRVSSHGNVKLREVAAELVRTRSLPGAASQG